MDSLRPDRDELDQFKSRKTGKKAKAPVASAGAKKPLPPRSGSSVILRMIVAISVLAIAALAWLNWQQRNEMIALQQQLEDASGFIGQSKLLLARLEGRVSETGEELAQSGSQVEKKLDFLDSEMRKLWGVSNDRNKKMIRDNEAAIAGLENRLAKYAGEQKALSGRLDKALKSFTNDLEQLGRVVRGMEVQVSAAANEAAVTRESLSESLAGLRARIASVDEATSGIRQNRAAISSIDTSRQQLNERVVELERQLNDIQLRLGGP